MQSAHAFHLLSLAPLFALLAWAAIEDGRTRKIRNWLTLAVAVTGVARTVVGVPAPPLWWPVAGVAVGIALTVPLVVLNAVGGGDLKLLAGVGAWVGPVVLAVFLIEKVVGLVWVLVHATAQRRVTALARSSAALAVDLAAIRHVGLDHVRQAGLSCDSVDRPLPYAVPVGIAVAALAIAGLV